MKYRTPLLWFSACLTALALIAAACAPDAYEGTKHEPGCKGCGGGAAPVAHAGPDQLVKHGELVKLDGRASTDTGGNPLTYAWSLVALPGGSTAFLYNETAAEPEFTADLAGDYVVELTVNDGKEDSPADQCIVTANSVPIADPGVDQNVVVGDLVTLDGSGSSDADGDSLTYAWSLVSWPSGSTAILSDATAVELEFMPDQPGDYVVELTVNDGVENSGVDAVQVTASDPLAATGISARSYGNRIYLSWTDPNLVGLVGARIRRGTPTCPVDPLADGVFVGDIAAGVQVADQGGLVHGTTYCYTVFGDYGASIYGPGVSASRTYYDAGSLDTTFNGLGYFTKDAVGGLSNSADDGFAVAVDSVDQILVAGSSPTAGSGHAMTLMRLSSTGGLDTNFDSDGIVVDDSAPGTDSCLGFGNLIGSTGKVYVTGRCHVSGSNDQMTVWRFNADGTPDSGFDSDGVFVDNTSATSDVGYANAVDASGNIIIAGQRGGSMAVWRVTSAGALDTPFGTSGRYTATGSGVGRAVAIEISGRILVAGEAGGKMSVWRLTPGGVLDTNFGGGDGVFDTVGEGYGVAIDASGRIVVAGDNNSLMTVWRLTSSGIADTNFGDGNGMFSDDAMAGGNGTKAGYAVAVDDFGGIIVTGEVGGTGDDMAVSRLTDSGALDISFGTNGLVSHNSAAGGNGNDHGFAVTIDSLGRLLIAGNSSGGSANNDVAVWRVNP